jgi:hypothetical protein
MGAGRGLHPTCLRRYTRFPLSLPCQRGGETWGMEGSDHEDGRGRFGREGSEEREEKEGEEEDKQEEDEDEPLATTPKSKRQRNHSPPLALRPRLQPPLGTLIRWEGRMKCVRGYNNSNAVPPLVCKSPDRPLC